MKSFLAILLLISFALPNAGWNQLLACAEMASAPTACGCCEPGHCACAQTSDQPAKPIPSVPPRAVTAPDSFCLTEIPPSPSPNLFRLEQQGRGRCTAPAVRTYQQHVPLYRWHCVVLC